MATSLPTLRHYADLQQQGPHAPLADANAAGESGQSFDLFLQALGLAVFVFCLVVSKGAR
jgi:hypothetical protein